jgi:hypothetical protein
MLLIAPLPQACACGYMLPPRSRLGVSKIGIILANCDSLSVD